MKDEKNSASSMHLTAITDFHRIRWSVRPLNESTIPAKAPDLTDRHALTHNDRIRRLTPACLYLESYLRRRVSRMHPWFIQERRLRNRIVL